MLSAFVSVDKVAFQSPCLGSSQTLLRSAAELAQSKSCSCFSFGDAELAFHCADELGIACLPLSSLGKSRLCSCGVRLGGRDGEALHKWAFLMMLYVNLSLSLETKKGTLWRMRTRKLHSNWKK